MDRCEEAPSKRARTVSTYEDGIIMPLMDVPRELRHLIINQVGSYSALYSLRLVNKEFFGFATHQWLVLTLQVAFRIASRVIQEPPVTEAEVHLDEARVKRMRRVQKSFERYQLRMRSLLEHIRGLAQRMPRTITFSSVPNASNGLEWLIAACKLCKDANPITGQESNIRSEPSKKGYPFFGKGLTRYGSTWVVDSPGTAGEFEDLYDSQEPPI